MDDKLAIYQLHVQSADKLDERRDTSVRAYGGLCVVLTAAAAGTGAQFQLLSAVLWGLLMVVAFAWRATLQSLTAKLTTKNRLLTEMEDNHDIPGAFLTRERQHWEGLGKPALAEALQRAPWAFLLLGAGGILGTLAYVAWTTLSLSR